MSSVVHASMIASNLETLQGAFAYRVENPRLPRTRFASVSPRIKRVTEALLHALTSAIHTPEDVARKLHGIEVNYQTNRAGVILTLVEGYRKANAEKLDAQYRERCAIERAEKAERRSRELSLLLDIATGKLRRLGVTAVASLTMFSSGMECVRFSSLGVDDREIVNARFSKRSRNGRSRRRRDELEILTAEQFRFDPAAGLACGRAA